MSDRPDYEALNQRVSELRKEIDYWKRENERMQVLYLALEQSTEGIAVVDLDGNLEYINHAFAEMHGYSVEELIGKNLSIFHTPDQMPHVKAANLELQEKGSFKGEIWHVKRDGTVFPTLMHNSLIRDDSGRPIGMMGTLRDITDITQTKEALEESEEKYRNLIKDSMDGIVIVGGSEIRMVNPALSRMLGVEEDEMVGRPVTDFVSPKYRDLITERGRARELGEEIPSRYEFVALRKDGTEFFAELSVSVIVFQGKIARQVVVRDISEQKRAEEELKKAEANLKALMENTSDYILISDDHGYPVIFNSSYARIMKEALGIDMKPGLKPHKLLTDEKVVSWWDNVHERVLRGEKLNTEYSHKFGENVRHLEISFNPIIRDGKVQGFTELTRDITQHKRTEEALRKSEERYRAHFENVSDVIYSLDRELRVLDVSPSVERVMGVKPEEVIGKRIPELKVIKPKSLERAVTNIARILQGEQTDMTTYQATARDGTRKWFEVNSSPLLHDGQIEAVIVVARDVTDRKRAEDALRESEENFRALAENANDGILIAVEEGKHVFANERAAELTGYTIAELLRTTIKDLAHPDEFERIKDRFETVISGRPFPNQYETKLIRKDGTERPVEVTSSRSLWENKPADIVIFRDLTERKKVEEALRTAHKRLEELVNQRTMELNNAIKIINRSDRELSERELALDRLNKELLQTNQALATLAKNIDNDKDSMQKNLVEITKTNILPILSELQNDVGCQRRLADLEVLRTYIDGLLTGSMDPTFQDGVFTLLSEQEMRVAVLTKRGLTGPKIADMLNISLETVKTHRRNIRKKLNLQNSNVNLSAYLKAQFTE